jgi:flagellar biosynthesis protein FlhG
MARCLLTNRPVTSPEGRRRGATWVVASGKGGVGKTIFALNLSIHLARPNCRVILLDADFGLANADILLDAAPRADFADVLDVRRPIDELLVAGPCGLRVLCGVSGLPRRGRPLQLNSTACSRVLHRLRAECDALVVDCGAGVTEPTLAFALASDLLILTTTPEPTALADAYALLKLLSVRGFSGRVGVVVNMVRSRPEGQRVARRLSDVAMRFLGLSVEDLGHVLADKHVPAAVRQRTPLAIRYPRSGASLCIEGICDDLLSPRDEPRAGRGVWARFANLFI